MSSDRTKSKGSLDDLQAFAAVARERSFTRAAAGLGVSTSMLSYTIRRLEDRLGLVLLRRTSRSVATTEAGATLLRTLQPALLAIQETLTQLEREHDRVSGTVRITATRQAYAAVLQPVIEEFVRQNPEATIEVIVDYGFRDIVADGFDAGLRLHEKVEQDMVAIPVGPSQLQMVVVASPGYLSRRPPPATPEALREHRCINYRMVSANTVYAWEFERAGNRTRESVAGPLTFNDPDLMLQAALAGLGIAYVLAHEAAVYVEEGSLVRLLEDWTTPFPGFCLYYPSRRQVSPALAALVALLQRARRNSGDGKAP